MFYFRTILIGGEHVLTCISSATSCFLMTYKVWHDCFIYYIILIKKDNKMRYEWITRLHRDVDHKVFGGVCSGLAEYFNMDVLVIRLLFVLGLLSTYPFVLLYIILWAIIPKR